MKIKKIYRYKTESESKNLDANQKKKKSSIFFFFVDYPFLLDQVVADEPILRGASPSVRV